jgi:hypothetical protein
MKPGERIRLIKEASDSLATRPWHEVQLTLGEFGLDTWEPNEDYGPSTITYCSGQIREASDETLMGLHEYLLGEDAAPIAKQVPGPWGSNPVRAFFSHVHTESALATEVKQRLGDKYGVDAFVAHDDINPSRQWREVIKAALASCDVFVAFLNDDFHNSQWCDQEVGWALARQIPIVPVRTTGSTRQPGRDGFLEEHQDVDLDRMKRGRGDWWVADQIFEIVLADDRTRQKGTRALGEAFVNSWSFDSTRRFWSLIERQSALEVETLRRLEYAVQTNRQVYQAVAGTPGVPIPHLVRSLVQKLEPAPVTEPWPDGAPF